MPFAKKTKKAFKALLGSGKLTVKKVNKKVKKIQRSIAGGKSFGLDQNEQTMPYIVGINSNVLLGLAVGVGFTLCCLSNLSGLSVAGQSYGFREGPKVTINRLRGNITVGPANAITWAAQAPYALDCRIMIVRIKQIPQAAQAGTNTIQFQDMMLVAPIAAMTQSHSQASFNPLSKSNFKVLMDKTIHIPVQGNGQMPLKADLKWDIKIKNPPLTTYNDMTNAVSSLNQNHYFVFGWCNASAASQALGAVTSSINTVTHYEE